MDAMTNEQDSEDESIGQADAFAALGLRAVLAENVRALGFDQPTPIQAAAIPPLLAGRSILGRARTGSGKTAAFGLPLLQAVEIGAPGPQALILAPTRELALQVTEALRTFAAGGGPGIVTIYGGSPYAPQLRALKAGVPVVVGTPGRVIDHLDRGSLKLGNLRMLVLDEADEMLKMGFIEDVEKVLEAAPETCQTALFSATMPAPIKRAADRYMTDPVTVQVEDQALTTSHIEQRAHRVPDRHKLEALIRVLSAEDIGATLVFCRTKVTCARLNEELGRRGYNVDALHGDLNQAARERVLGRMRDKRLDLLVATDVAARGLDVEHITHVINFDMPTDAEVYTHRIGRTGRAGRSGTAITFVAPQEMGRIRHWGRKLGGDVPGLPVPSDAAIAARRQGKLLDGLDALVKADDTVELRRWLENAAEERGWDPMELATAAVALLAESRGKLDLNPDDRPPAWNRPPSGGPGRDRSQGPRGGHGTPYSDRRGPSRAGGNDGPGRHAGPGRNDRPVRNPGPARNAGPARGASAHGDEVEVFFAAGRERGVRPGDLVGALANEVGIPGGHIGRITILDRKSFVRLPREVAERLLSTGATLNVRGGDIRMAISHEGGAPRGPGGGHSPAGSRRG